MQTQQKINRICCTTARRTLSYIIILLFAYLIILFVGESINQETVGRKDKRYPNNECRDSPHVNTPTIVAIKAWKENDFSQNPTKVANKNPSSFSQDAVTKYLSVERNKAGHVPATIRKREG